MFTHRTGKIPQDENHPYGHGRAETIGATIIGLFITLTGIGVIHETFEAINGELGATPGPLAAIAAVLSIMINESLFHYTRRVGESTQGPSLIANAWHHRTDAISSVAVLIGVIGAGQGFPFMNPLAGIVARGMIVKVGLDITRLGLRDLMDTALIYDHTKQIILF